MKTLEEQEMDLLQDFADWKIEQDKFEKKLEKIQEKLSHKNNEDEL